MRVLCAMSGGVDSSVAALLLKEAGHEVVGIFMRLGPVEGGIRAANRSCCSVADSRDAALVAARLDIPFYAANYREEFERIIDDFVEEYHRGRTPNPCVRCNQWLKFGSLLRKAKALGCDAVATGHYARIECGPDGRHRLLRGADRRKDQSYFLFLMPPASLARTLFPVGGLTKETIRALARDAGLPVAEKPESQEICFVPSGDYRDVLRSRSPERLRPGRFVGVDGRELGEHPGHQFFTIGQRRGLGIAAGSPRYVVGIDPATNTVTLGPREALLARKALVKGVSWLSIEPPAAGRTLEAEVQIRYRHDPAPALVHVLEDGTVEVEFERAQSAVTPGQAAVFYRGDVVLGGGWIEGSRAS